MSTATKKLRTAVFRRASEACEGCGRHITEETGHLDHFFGRAKAEESLENCWALCLACDDAKTVNRPSAAHWLERFITHADRYAYEAAAERAHAKLLVLVAKGRAA